MAFNPLDPKQTVQEGSFAAKLAARKAAAEGKDANDTSIVDVSSLTEDEKTQLVRNNNIRKAEEEFKFILPHLAKEAVVIVFDDSGSMDHQKIQDARDGVTEFMRECVPNETAVKIAPLNEVEISFSCNLPSLALQVVKIHASGGTPLYEVTQRNMYQDGEVKPTRMILFSDGSPNNPGSWEYPKGDYSSSERHYEFSIAHKKTIEMAIERGIALDTCLIADRGYSKKDVEYMVMEDLAAKTGGIFIVFEKGKCSFKHGFKYLTKGNRLLLMDSNFKNALESGQI
jgi:Mg-chelatase subunit ChlD